LDHPCEKIGAKKLLHLYGFRRLLTQSIAHSYAALTWRLIVTLNETAFGSSGAQIWSPKRCWIGNAIASDGLKWQYIAI